MRSFNVTNMKSDEPVKTRSMLFKQDTQAKIGKYGVLDEYLQWSV